MEIRPVGKNDLSFPYKNNKVKKGMVYEPKGDTPFPPKLKAIIIIPKGNIEVNEDDRTNS